MFYIFYLFTVYTLIWYIFFPFTHIYIITQYIILKLVTEFGYMFIFYIFNLAFINIFLTLLIIYFKFFKQYWLKTRFTKLFFNEIFVEKITRFTSQVVISQREVETHYALYVYKVYIAEWVKSSNWFSYLKKKNLYSHNQLDLLIIFA